MLKLAAPALVAAALAAQATAQNADQDVRCLMASNTFARVEKDAGKQRAAAESLVFYLGRLDGRVTPAQLKARLLAQGKQLTPATLGPIMDACVRRLGQSQAALQAIGRELAPAKGK